MKYNENVEEFLYSLISSLSSMNLPIVFTGAVVLKAIQNMYGNPSGLERDTHDIDADWVGQVPSMDYLYDIITKAVRLAGHSDIFVEIKRKYEDGQSAGFYFVRRGKRIAAMDLSIKQNMFGMAYSGLNGIKFYGQSIDKIIADKISVTSQRVVLRRIKDVIDLYILSFIWKGSARSIVNVINASGSTLDAFTVYLNDYEGLKHAYSKYENRATAHDFDIVYRRVGDFLVPFICGRIDVHWNGVSWY